jgi:hypothetical protein
MTTSTERWKSLLFWLVTLVIGFTVWYAWDITR